MEMTTNNKVLHKKDYTKKIVNNGVKRSVNKKNVSPLGEHLPLKDASSSIKLYTKRIAQISINNQCEERSVNL